MSTELDRRPVTCRARNCGRAGPMHLMVKASVVLERDNARGWFCPACAQDGGHRQLPTGSEYVLPAWARPRCENIKIDQLYGKVACTAPEGHRGEHFNPVMGRAKQFWV